MILFIKLKLPHFDNFLSVHKEYRLFSNRFTEFQLSQLSYACKEYLYKRSMGHVAHQSNICYGEQAFAKNNHLQRLLYDHNRFCINFWLSPNRELYSLIIYAIMLLSLLRKQEAYMSIRDFTLTSCQRGHICISTAP